MLDPEQVLEAVWQLCEINQEFKGDHSPEDISHNVEKLMEWEPLGVKIHDEEDDLLADVGEEPELPVAVVETDQEVVAGEDLEMVSEPQQGAAKGVNVRLKGELTSEHSRSWQRSPR
jgi:hypothetical protein